MCAASDTRTHRRFFRASELNGINVASRFAAISGSKFD
jgi:hypothetical protein